MLWAYRTTSLKPTGESPFAVTYGMEAIIPTKIGMPTIRMKIPEQAKTEVVIKDLNKANKLREATIVRIASYQQRLASLHSICVPRTFKAGELVLRRVFENMANPGEEKFQLN